MAAKLQLALDFLDLDRALKVAKACGESVDILEAGTPLIKSEGLESVRALRRLFPKKEVVADMKVMDAGRAEVESASKAGGDWVDVLSAASDSTISECVQAAANVGAKVCVDLISSEDPVGQARRAQALGADMVAVHTPIDDQMRDEKPFDTLGRVCAAVDIPVAAAGGLNSETVYLAQRAGADVVIVGGAITKAKDPAKAASDIKDALLQDTAVESRLFKRSKDISSVLEMVSSSNVSDAMHRRGQLTGIHALTDVKAFGQAVTVMSYPGDWAKPVEAIDVAKEGDVIVVTTAGVGPACWGELATQSAKLKKIAAVVVDGAVRDTGDIKKAGFPVYCRHVCPNAGEPKGLGEINCPIKVGEVTIKPGDWIICDQDGVVAIPKEDAVEIANRAQDVLEKENRIREEILEGGSLGSVTHLLKWEKKR